MSKTIVRYILIIFGSLSLLIGVIGIAIPVLPTTPFLLITSFCYLRSSSRLYQWLMNHRTFGPYLYNYLTYRAVKKSVKVVALITLWFSLGLSIIIVPNIYLKIMLSFIGTMVSIHLLRLKTLKAIDSVNEVKDKKYP